MNITIIFCLDAWIECTDPVYEGETASFCGKVHFHKSIRHLKWQKYQNDGYIDINIHKEKYQGSKNDLENPTLKVHKVNAEDEVKYRLEIKTNSFTKYSNTITLKVTLVSGEFVIIIFFSVSLDDIIWHLYYAIISINSLYYYSMKQINQKCYD